MQNTENNTSNSDTSTFDDVKEKEEIKKSRAKRLPKSNNSDEELFVGLAFSGGGIRSATFNLGVLQGMAKLGILTIFDYLSTVSGGGYIGSWLIAWIKSEGKKKNGNNNKTNKKTGLEAAIEKLKPEWNEHDNKETEEIHRLRDYSNYLTPRKGLLGADTWLLLTTYLRNAFFNLLILVSVLFSIITLILAILIFLYHPSSPLHNRMEIVCWYAPTGFIVVCGILYVVVFRNNPKKKNLLTTFICSLLFVFAALSFSYGLWKGCYLNFKYPWNWYRDWDWHRDWKWLLIFVILFGPFLSLAFSFKKKEGRRRKFAFSIFAGILAGVLFFFLSCWMQKRDIAVSDFREDEFIDLLKVEALCEMLRKDGIINDKEISFKTHENTIAHFNEIVEIPQLYYNFINRYKNLKAFPKIECIIEDRRNYRNSIMLWEINDQKEDIKLQNWFLLKIIYPKMFPDYQIQLLYKNISMQKTLPKSNDESLVQWLNRLIRSPVFFDIIPQTDFSTKIKYLIDKTLDARKENFFHMDDEDRNMVKKLNRLLIEEIFPNDYPGSKSDRLIFACFGIPTVILIFLFAGALCFLPFKNAFSDDERKSLGHFAVSLLGWTALITALFAVTIFGRAISGKIVDWLQYFATFAWVHVMLVMSGLLQRFIPGTEGKGAKWGFKIAIALGMCIIIGGLLSSQPGCPISLT